MGDRRENISWLVGVLVSGLVHVGAGVGAARYGTLMIGAAGDIGDGGTPIQLLSAEDETKEQAEEVPPPPPVLAPPHVDPVTQERVMRLGIRESMQNTDAWLGFNEAAEHSGVISTLDQAQLSLQPGDAGMPGDAAGEYSGAQAARAVPLPSRQPAEMQPPASEAPTPAAHAAMPDAKPATNEPAPGVALPEGAKRPGEAEGESSEKLTAVNGEKPREGKDPLGAEHGDASQEAVAPSPVEALKLPDGALVGPAEVLDDPLLPAAMPIGVAPIKLPPVGVAPKATQEKVEVVMPVDPLTPVMPAAPKAMTPPAESGAPQGTAGSVGSAKAAPGNKSDREADAASKKGPIDVRPGKPAAGQGLEIQTVRPKWSITVQLTSVPKNPMVRIIFGPDGKVKNAAFLVGQDTGSTEVDGPLLDAIYRWTAKGKAIDQLPKNDPKAGVPLIMRIVLRG